MQINGLTKEQLIQIADDVELTTRSTGWKHLMEVLAAQIDILTKKLVLAHYEKSESYDSLRAQIIALHRLIDAPRLFIQESLRIKEEEKAQDNSDNKIEAPDNKEG